ncbi:MAG TPA: DUF4386 domain-containing protein [Allosphingosinicella sp.]|jgi:hypothetical protein
MSGATPDPRHGSARLTGLLYVLSNITAIFAFWVRSRLVAGNDPARTADNIMASEPLFRAGLASELVTIVLTTALVLGLYVVLKPVGRNLASLALLWRILENSVLAALTFASFTALALLGGGAYLASVDTAQAEGLAYALIRVHIYGFQAGFLFLGLGSALFSYLWLKSRYIPPLIAAWGIFASLLMASVSLALIVMPGLISVITLAYMLPMGLYEIGLGLWLVAKGIRLPEQARPSADEAE